MLHTPGNGGSDSGGDGIATNACPAECTGKGGSQSGGGSGGGTSDIQGSTGRQFVGGEMRALRRSQSRLLTECGWEFTLWKAPQKYADTRQ